MNKVEVLEKVKELGLLAVIRGPSPELTVKMVEALVAGGVLGIEITYSTPNAEEVVRTLSKKFGDEHRTWHGNSDQARTSPICQRSWCKLSGQPNL